MLMLRKVMDVDTRSGEIINEKSQYIQDTFNDGGYRVPSHKRKSAMFADVNFPNEMNDAEVGRMARLSKMMISTTNMLGYRKGPTIYPYTDAHLVEVLHMSPYRGREFLQKMIRLGVIQKIHRSVGKTECDEYYINPAYFFAGKRISLSLYLLFRENLDPILPEWVKAEFLNLVKEQDKESVRDIIRLCKEA